MRRFHKKLMIPITGILLFVFFLMLVSRGDVLLIDVEDGLLDLSDVQENKTLSLGGTWIYYEHQLYGDLLMDGEIRTVPHLFEPHVHYATYVAVLTGLKPMMLYDIALKDAGTAYRLYVNNQLILSNGVVSNQIERFVPYSRFEHATFFADENGQAEIIISIASYGVSRSGFWEKIEISPSGIASTLHHNQLLVTTLMSGWFIALAVFFTSLHILSRKEQRGLLLGLFALLMALRTLITNQRILLYMLPYLPWTLVIKLDYGMGMILFPIFGLLLTRMDFVKRNVIVDRLLFSSVIVLLSLSVILSAQQYFIVFEIFKYALLITSPYFIYMMLMGISKKVRGAKSFFITSLILLIATILEMFFNHNQTLMLYAAFILVNLISIIFAEDFIISKALNQRLEDTLLIDPLTNVYNRLFLNQLIETNGKNTMLTEDTLVLFIDFNTFKQTNDLHGHVIGDQILIEIAQRMKEFFEHKAFITRYGGDEFVILYPIKANQDVERLVEALKSYIAQPIEIQNQRFIQTVSIGYSLFNPSMDHLEETIRMSDSDMYLRKTDFQTEALFKK
jgi:diguanylate cyclase (GGDEF)-like protein